MPNYKILYNPHAANGRGKENAERLKAALTGSLLDFQDITQIEDYSAFFVALPQDWSLVVSGGDGTLNRFINDTAHTVRPKNILYFASGSGNDFLRDVKDQAHGPLILMDPYLEALPQVTVNGHTCQFLNGIGFGLDGYCCEIGDRLRTTTAKPVNYTAIAIKGLLFHYKPTGATVTVDGTQYRYERVWLAPTMNGRYYGGGMMPTPEQDRLNPARTVSAMVFHGSGKLKTLMIFPSIFQGKHIRRTREVAILTGRDITVTFDRPTALQIDGETILNAAGYHVAAAKAPACV